MGDHFDTDTLADHTEGLLEPTEDANVRAHIAWCTECGGVVEQLSSVRTVLSSLPEPSMPDDVMARIDASLAQAQSERASMTRSEQPAQARRQSWLTSLFHRPGLLAGAAVFVIGIAFVGGYLTTRGGGGDDGEQANPTISDAGEPMFTGRAYTKDGIAGQARSLLALRMSDTYTPDPAKSKAVDGSMRRLTDPEELDRCTTTVTNGHLDRLMAVDLSSFDGKPAAIIVMSSKKAGSYEVAAVGPGCTKGDAKIIYRTQVPGK